MQEDGATTKLWRFWRVRHLGCTQSSRAGWSGWCLIASTTVQPSHSHVWYMFFGSIEIRSRYFNSSTVIMVQLCQDVWWCDWVSVRQLIAEQTVCYCSVQLFCAWAQPESPWKSSIQSCFWRLVPPVDVSLMAAEMRHWLVLDVKIKSEQVRVSFPESSHGSVFSSNTSRVWNGQVLDILQGTQQNLSGKGWIGTWLYASKIPKSGTLPLQSHWHFLVLAANPSPICCQACPRLSALGLSLRDHTPPDAETNRKISQIQTHKI